MSEPVDVIDLSFSRATHSILDAAGSVRLEIKHFAIHIPDCQSCDGTGQICIAAFLGATDVAASKCRNPNNEGQHGQLDVRVCVAYMTTSFDLSSDKIISLNCPQHLQLHQ